MSEMNIETEKFNEHMAKMKSRMNVFQKRLYGIISNSGVDRNDLDILLTFAFVSGQQEGLDFSKELMNGVKKGLNNET